jgi:hypothetical protein
MIGRPEALPREIAFLEGRHVDRATLLRAARMARRWRVSPEQVLLKCGWITAPAYYQALSAHIGLPYSALRNAPVHWQAFRHRKGQAMARANIIPLAPDRGGLKVAIAPEGPGLRKLIALSDRPDAARHLRNHLFLTTPRDISDTILRGFHAGMNRRAAEHLAATSPDFSAAGGMARAQALGLAIVAGLCLLGLMTAPWFTLVALNLVLGLVFVAVSISRVAAVAATFGGWPKPAGTDRARPTADQDLPVYSLLVPLYREAEVVPHLLAAMNRLDYPKAKLDIKLILEEDDREPRRLAAGEKTDRGALGKSVAVGQGVEDPDPPGGRLGADLGPLGILLLGELDDPAVQVRAAIAVG